MLVCFGMPNAVWRQCDVCATAKASDGMLLSRVPIPGCCSPLPLGPTSAFQEIGLGLLPTSASGRATGTQPTSVTALGGPAVSIQLLQGPRGAGGPWPDGICPGPAQRSAARPRGAQLHLELGCSQPSTLRAAWNQRRAAVAGWGRMQARRIDRTGDCQWARVPANGSCRYARYRSTDARGLWLVHAALPSMTTALA